MEVPFRSSGASSRQHYALVRKVEGAPSAQAADQLIVREVQAVKHQIRDAGLVLKQCKELLIILLYCQSAVSAVVLDAEALHFAIPHALNLAEGSAAISDKRIGYLFCAQVMPHDHELQLMLVNTLRKDLESSSPQRICLALDALISSSTDDMIPAILPRLHDLLGHNSQHVRRRVLLAFRALTRHDPDIMQTITHTLFRRLQDPDSSIAAAAFLASVVLPKDDHLRTLTNDLFSSNPHPQSKSYLISAMRALGAIGLSKLHLPYVLKIIRISVANKQYAILIEAFLLFASLRSGNLLGLPLISRRAPVESIRPLLSSRDPNERYVFLLCIDCVDPRWWAGTTPEAPPLLEQREVQDFMTMLDSPDSLIRRKAVKILNKVDMNIVSTYYNQALQKMPPDLEYTDRIEYTCRLLEVLEVVHAEDGEQYARGVITLFEHAEPPSPSPDGRRILEIAVEKTLTFVRDGTPMFQMAAATIFLGHMLEQIDVRPTLMVILGALACEYCGKLSFPPEELLNGLTTKVLSLPPSVQDVCLLAMLRVSAECDSVSADVKTVVSHLASTSGRYIRKRCEQFLRLSSDKDTLSAVMKEAKSFTFPDVLSVLTTNNSPSAQSSPLRQSRRLSPTSSPNLSSSKLRYAAYEAPPTPRPRTERKPSLARSETDSLDSIMSRTMTPGELTLSPTRQLEQLSLSPLRPSRQLREDSPIQESRADLIAFDTPFFSDAPLADDLTNASPQKSKQDFQSCWDSMEKATSSRGWFEGQVDALLSKVKNLKDVEVKIVSAEQEPFIGEIKVLVFSGASTAALRIRGNEDEGCLWRMRSEDAQLGVAIKRLLSDE